MFYLPPTVTISCYATMQVSNNNIFETLKKFEKNRKKSKVDWLKFPNCFFKYHFNNCSHKFCFLCVKGIRSSPASKTCAFCRQPFSLEEVVRNLTFVPEEVSEVKWHYSGKTNGWWEYDDRASKEIEAAFQKGEKKLVIHIAGFTYEVDFEKMVI